MEPFFIVVNQIGMFAIYMFVGVILIKTHVFNAVTLEPVSRFVLKLALPLLIFTNTLDGVTRESLFRTLPVVLLSAVLYLTVYLTALFLAKLFHLTGDKKQVYRALTMFGNIGFMAIPIIISLFPEKGMLYISLFTIVDQMVLWTLGVKLTTPEGKDGQRFEAKKMINPATVAVVLAVILILCNISLMPVLSTALTKIGQSATPLAMIYLGGIFGCMDIREYIKKKEFYGIVAVKMLLVPLIIFVVFGFLPITEEIRMTMAMISGMPAMSSIVMMAKANGSEGEYAVGGIFVTTMCAMVTLPSLCWMFQLIP